MFGDWNTLQWITKDWPLLESPLKITIVCAAYLVFVLYAGPKFMANRPAYSLKKVIMVYNVFQIIVSYYLAREILANGVSFTDIWVCFRSDYSDSSQNIYRASLAYYAFLLKIIELIETVFFVLRKKQKQISFLHVYHHISTIYIAYFSTKHIGCGLGCICLVLNMIVHFFMYLYYLMSSFGITNWERMLLVYKKAITKLQLIQFLIMLTQAFFVCSTPNCMDEISIIGFSFALPDVLILLYLFSTFYIKSYNQKKIHPPSTKATKQT